MNVDALRRQHQDIRVIARSLGEAVSDNSQPRGVGALRWRLARALMEHLALEDGILYPTMQRLPEERHRATALRLQAEIGSTAQTFTTYMTQWTDDRIAREWPVFCTETRALLDALARRIEQEERILYPIADTAARGTPAARAG
ncbi:hemerythrin domain-containing protein [Sphingobium ummariense]|uniref:Hemerythrin-like domain-containing protein n=1 Tax=Sphingobium ummariense RL-3 TaxID=1346791 RepID=T0J4L5_9SPHN|nr:hemerythrin domain-containing protein [Sphingobium ummariense]EQB32891.1 hypothetical protein M529_07580 [Sphingobium ummariense RL-3]